MLLPHSFRLIAEIVHVQRTKWEGRKMEAILKRERRAAQEKNISYSHAQY
jgi:hypothetical protein